MAYCQLGDVRGLVSNWTIDSSSSPSSTEAQAIIDGVDGVIDGVLAGVGLTVPVTSPARFVELLKSCSMYGSAAQVLKSMFPEERPPGAESAWKFWSDEHRAILEGLKSGALIPHDAAYAIEKLPATELTRNPDELEDLGDRGELNATVMDKVF